ncbi:hypothetical protein CK203_079928 [Vitis vinifera]|uniref:Auxin-responsive protein SAUR72 n=1 Tax=Vitis vinifera TaxID=29760 RepID=A0A438E591_VITVI|nr:hypothetical protein CK203_079928 [Vitis vinifera]
MDSKKSNKISEIVRLQQILKKWKKLANAPRNSNKNGSHSSTSSSSNNGSKSIKFLKKTLSFTDTSSMLSTEAFGVLLREAEEEFGFQQEGVLKIPCEVAVFEKILEVVEEKRDHVFFLNAKKEMIGCCSSSDCELTPSHHPQMCR